VGGCGVHTYPLSADFHSSDWRFLFGTFAPGFRKNEKERYTTGHRVKTERKMYVPVRKKRKRKMYLGFKPIL
jgi:hypothetical protein